MNRKILFLIACMLIRFTPEAMAQTSQTTGPFVCPPCFDGACDHQTYDKPGHCPHCNMALIPKSNIKHVAILVYNGVELLDFSGPGEVFAATNVSNGAFRVFTVATQPGQIVSQGFLKVQPDYTINDCPAPDIIVLPGGNVTSSVNNPEVITWISKHAPDLDALMSVCNGALILQKTGLLDNKKATTHHSTISTLRSQSPTTEVLENTRWVECGKIITTAGVSAGIDGALRIVERLYGRQTAEATARYMEYDKWDPGDGVVVR